LRIAGINDGFLSPYKVKRVRTNIDEYIYTREDTVVQGAVDRPFYTMPDFNTKVVLPDRTELVAKTILQQIRPFDKTIVFCVDQEHALLLRDMINKHKTITDPFYCVRITSDEGKIGRELLEKFQDNDRDIPTILTSSQMLTTGVDARNVRNIVLVRTINSMVEFKQIVGRGTRVFDGKDFFTIIDFTGATELFYDEAWDGLPEEQREVQVEQIGVATFDESPIVYPPTSEDENQERETTQRARTVIRLKDGRKLKVIDVETRYIDEDGRPLSAEEFLESLIGKLPTLFESEERLRDIWSQPNTRKELLQQMEGMGFDLESMYTLQQMLRAEDSDIFDVLAHIAFNTSMVTREKRAVRVRGNEVFFKVFKKLEARKFLEFVLDRYVSTGVEELDQDHLGELIQISGLKTATEAVAAFGNVKKMQQAFLELQQALYENIA